MTKFSQNIQFLTFFLKFFLYLIQKLITNSKIQGGEFMNSEFKAYCLSKNIRIINPRTSYKCVFVERFNGRVISLDLSNLCYFDFE